MVIAQFVVPQPVSGGLRLSESAIRLDAALGQPAGGFSFGAVENGISHRLKSGSLWVRVPPAPPVPAWWNRRHTALRTQRLRSWGFNSLRGHQQVWPMWWNWQTRWIQNPVLRREGSTFSIGTRIKKGNMICATTKLKASQRPIFMQNLCAFWGMSVKPEDQLAVFVAFGARLGNKWMDETSIKKSAAHLRHALVLYRMLRNFAAWELLEQPHGGLSEIVRFYKRLKGIVDPENRLSFGSAHDIRRVG